MTDSFVYVSLAIPIGGFSIITILVQKARILNLRLVEFSLYVPLLGALFAILQQLFMLFQSYNYFMPALGIKIIQQFNLYAQIMLFTGVFVLACCQLINTCNLQKLQISHMITMQISMCVALIVALTDTFYPRFCLMILSVGQLVIVVFYCCVQAYDIYFLNFKKIRRQIKYFMFKQRLNDDLQQNHLCHLGADGVEYGASGYIVSLTRFKDLPRDFQPLFYGIPVFVIVSTAILAFLVSMNIYLQDAFANRLEVAINKVDRYNGFYKETSQWAYALVEAQKALDLLDLLWHYIVVSLSCIVVALLIMYLTINSQPQIDDIFRNSFLFQLFTRWLYANNLQDIECFLIDAMRLKNQQKIDFQQFDLFCLKYKALSNAGKLPLSDFAISQGTTNLEQLQQGYNNLQYYYQEDDMQWIDTQKFEYQYKNIRSFKFSLVNKVFYLGEMELSLFLCYLGQIFLEKDIDMYLYYVFNCSTRKQQFSYLLFGNKKQKISKQLYYDYGVLNEIYDFDYQTKKNYISEFYEYHKALIHQLRESGMISKLLDFEFDANIFAYFYNISETFYHITGVLNRRFGEKVNIIKVQQNEMILASIYSIGELQTLIEYSGPKFVHFNLPKEDYCIQRVESSKQFNASEYKVTYGKQMDYFLLELQQLGDQARMPMMTKSRGTVNIGEAAITDHFRNQFSNQYCLKVKTPLPCYDCHIHKSYYNLLDIASNCTIYQEYVILALQYVATELQPYCDGVETTVKLRPRKLLGMNVELFESFFSKELDIERINLLSHRNALLIVYFVISLLQPMLDFSEDIHAKFFVCLEIYKLVLPDFRLEVAYLIHRAFLLQRAATSDFYFAGQRFAFSSACAGICALHVAESSPELQKAYMYCSSYYCLASHNICKIYSTFCNNEHIRSARSYENACVHFFMQDSDFLKACSEIRKTDIHCLCYIAFFDFFFYLFLVNFAVHYGDIKSSPQENEWFYGVCKYFNIDPDIVL